MSNDQRLTARAARLRIGSAWDWLAR